MEGELELADPIGFKITTMEADQPEKKSSVAIADANENTAVGSVSRSGNQVHPTKGGFERAPDTLGSYRSLGDTNMAKDGQSGRMSEPEPPAKDTGAPPVPHRHTSFRISSKTLTWASIAIIIVIGIILAVFLTQKDPEEPEVGNPPISVDFSTGVSLVTSYAIEATVRSRLARTTIKMEVANALPCSSIHVISLQLPLNTRITSLKTTSDDGCTSTGDVQELREARETFMDSAKNGVPGVYVESREDSFTHSLQVAIPPLGTSNVELVLEQLLKQRLGEVNFEVPLAPNEKVDSIVFDLSVEDTKGQPADFHADFDVPGVYEAPAKDSNMAGIADPIHLDIPDARQYDLPKVIRGRYDPGELPENGLLYTDGRCFEHFFHPTSLQPMPRNFHFVLDTSESMNSNSKLDHAKKAMVVFIDSLRPEDTFTIQTFGDTGTEEMWGSGPGSPEEKEEAKQFINALSASSWRTDLHDALLLGLLRAKADAKKSKGNDATVLVLLSDGFATRGETNRTKIAEHVYKLNKEGMVKIFSLGFQDSADMELLDAIALMNGGVSAPILRGQDDFAKQITNFLESELGSVLMSDINVKYSTGASSGMAVFGETQRVFPVLADGYDVVVRGLVGDIDGANRLNATVSASTMDGIKNWEISAVSNADNAAKSSLCFQSYAHDRITQLLRYYDASEFLGDDLIKRLVTLSRKDCNEEKFAKCVRAEALALATESNVVAKGLTAMVTVDDEKCMKLDKETDVCIDGTTPDPNGKPQHQTETSHEYGYDSYDVDHEDDESAAAVAPAPASEPYYEEVPDPESGTRTLSHGWASTLLALLSVWLFITDLKM